MKPDVCRYCGLGSVLPHQTQQACIQALRTEIMRTRQILANGTEPLVPVIRLDRPDLPSVDPAFFQPVHGTRA